VTEYQRTFEQPIPNAGTFFRANTFVTGIDYVF